MIVGSHIYSQSYCENRYDYTWLMGDYDIDTTEDIYGGFEINFNSTPPLVKTHPKWYGMPLHNLSMSSKNGDLIFYSNGCLVLNKLDLEMENGGPLNPGEVYDYLCPVDGYNGLQSMLSIPNPYDSTLYYIFHISQYLPHDTNAFIPVLSENLYFTVVDMALNNGLGKVITKNEVIFKDTSMIGTPLTATKHANGIDWWIITPDRWLNAFHYIFLGKDGPKYLGKQFIGIPPNPVAEGGQGKFSPDGTKFAWFHPRFGVYLYDFDRQSGLLSNFQHIEIPVADFIVGGCEFSPSGRFVYLNNDYDLYQVDTESEDVQESVVLIDTYDGFGDPLPTRFFYMERTPDDRIFMNVVNGSQYFHVIQEPNKKGIACRFEQHAIKFPTINNFTLPHFPNYRLGALGEVLCDTITYATELAFEDRSLLIYPNPANDYINIVLPDKKVIIGIYDFYGKLIYKNDDCLSSILTVNLTSFPNGMYVIYGVRPNGNYFVKQFEICK